MQSNRSSKNLEDQVATKVHRQTERNRTKKPPPRLSKHDDLSKHGDPPPPSVDEPLDEEDDEDNMVCTSPTGKHR